VSRLRAVTLIVLANAGLLACTANAPANLERPADNMPTPATKASDTSSPQQSSKPQPDCVYGEVAQHYEVDIARLEGEPSAHLNYCFVSGYRGIGCPDDGTITYAAGSFAQQQGTRRM
jgi:hypothetical protein